MAREATAEETRQKIEPQISKIFDQVQTSTSNHRKNHVALYKLHTQLAAIKKTINHGAQEKLVGEGDFKRHFNDLLARTFHHKKGVGCADRVIKFVGSYVRFINEKALEERNPHGDGDEAEGEDEDEENHVTRFTAQLLDFLVEGIASKDKNIRYRVLQTIAEMISYLGSIDSEKYEKLKAGILERTHDREANIRVQAAISLAKLSDSDEPDPDSESPSIQDSLIQILAHDSSAEVRRNTLLNIPINRQTLPHVLARMRDTEISIRKSVYSLILEDRVKPQADSKWQDQVNYLHPLCLSIAQREQIIRNGLRDREPTIKAATESLIITWSELVGKNIGPDSTDEAAGEDKGESTSNERILVLLSLFYLQGEDIIAESLLETLFNNSNIFRTISFEGTYWEKITLEKALFARVFVQHCRKYKKDQALEDMLPVVTKLAFHIQSAYNALSQQIGDEAALKLTSSDEDTTSVAELEEEREMSETILSELLKLALDLDYSDEIGRRKMLQLVREMIRCDTLSEPAMLRCLDVLRVLTSTEKDLVRLVVEQVQDLQDGAYNSDDIANEEQNPDVSIDENQQPPSSKPARTPYGQLSLEQKAHVDDIDLKCLALLSGMLERVNGKLQENSTLDGVLQNLIIPSIQRKDLRFRQRGFKCMALYCLIAKDLAIKSFAYYTQQVAGSPVAIKVTIMQSVFDMLMMHESALFQASATAADQFVELIVDLLGNEEDATLKAVLCEGASKLILANGYNQKELLTSIHTTRLLANLIKTFISPTNKDNQDLRQCLNLFFKRFSWFSKSCQQKIREAFVHIFLDVCQDRRATGNDNDDIMTSAALTDMFIHWTDPVQLAEVIRKPEAQPLNEHVDYSVHIDLAHDILKLMVNRQLTVTLLKEDKRVLCQALNRLYVPDTIDDLKIKTIKVLMRHVHQRFLGDAVSKNAFKKFEAMIDKKFEKELENCSDEDLRNLDGLQDLFLFLDDLIPLSDDEDEELTGRAKKRRSQSTASMAADGPVDEDQLGSGSGRANKRARLSADSKRVLPKRTAKTNAKPIQFINLEENEDVKPDTLESAVSRLSVGDESQLDRDISKLLDPLSTTSTNTIDSIMDEGTENEEEEVSELLAEY